MVTVASTDTVPIADEADEECPCPRGPPNVTFLWQGIQLCDES
jgi:hypothetical protein